MNTVHCLAYDIQNEVTREDMQCEGARTQTPIRPKLAYDVIK